MSDRTLGIGCVSYDRVKPIEDGRVGIPGYHVDFRRMGPAAIHAAAFEKHALSVAEVSTAGLALEIDAGRAGYVALPVYLSRAFRHGCIYVRGDSPFQTPQALSSARIGLADFFGTSAIWQRGMLQDEYGVDLRRASWVIGPVEDPKGPAKMPPDHVSAAFRIERAAAGTTLVEMMQRGDLDAMLVLRTPRAVRERHPAIVRLFPDYEAEERAYWRRTRCFPIMHIAVLRSAEITADPALPRLVQDAFEAAKGIALTELAETAYYFASLPWLAGAVEATQATMGRDWWRYGREEGAAQLATFLRYCHEQTLTRRLIGVDEFLPDLG